MVRCSLISEYESTYVALDELSNVIKQLRIHLDDNGRRTLDFLLDNIVTEINIEELNHASK